MVIVFVIFELLNQKQKIKDGYYLFLASYVEYLPVSYISIVGGHNWHFPQSIFLREFTFSALSFFLTITDEWKTKRESCDCSNFSSLVNDPFQEGFFELPRRKKRTNRRHTEQNKLAVIVRIYLDLVSCWSLFIHNLLNYFIKKDESEKTKVSMNSKTKYISRFQS